MDQCQTIERILVPPRDEKACNFPKTCFDDGIRAEVEAMVDQNGLSVPVRGTAKAFVKDAKEECDTTPCPTRSEK